MELSHPGWVGLVLLFKHSRAGSPAHLLVEPDSFSTELAAILWHLYYRPLLYGPTGVGKTTLMNARN